MPSAALSRTAALLVLTLAGPVAAQGTTDDAPAAPSLSFYVGGHQDDWQLFRGNAAAADLATPGARVVFVYATAGDAGRTDGWWEARERGALESVRALIGPAPVVLDVAEMNGHPIVRYTLGPSVSYVLRLPDGRWRAGDGYPSTGNESLSLLRDTGRPVSAVDGSTTYATWEDFWRTLEAILAYERAQLPEAGTPWVHAPDYSGEDNASPTCASAPGCNPCDHPDHTAVGDALRAFVGGAYHRSWWVGYDAVTRPENLDGAAFAQKGVAFFGYAEAVREETARGGEARRPDLGEWRAWGARDYVRTVPRGEPDVDAPVCRP